MRIANKATPGQWVDSYRAVRPSLPSRPRTTLGFGYHRTRRPSDAWPRWRPAAPARVWARSLAILDLQNERSAPAEHIFRTQTLGGTTIETRRTFRCAQWTMSLDPRPDMWNGGQQICKGLARTSRCDSQHICASKRCRPTLPLNARGLRETRLDEESGERRR